MKVSHELIPAASLNLNEVTIDVRGLYKHYGKTIAIRGLDLQIRRGELFGLIGPDGAGKTTTFNILGGVMEATAGDAKILGLPARDARNYTGYLTQQFSLYPDLSVDENIYYSAGLRLVPENQLEARRSKYLKLMQLDSFRDRLAGRLSGGMKQKLALCCALIAEPQVLLLDEPTTGVDTIARREFWDILAGLTAQNITVLVATPDLDEAERCDRVALIYNGQIQQMGSPAELKGNLGLNRLIIRTSQLIQAEKALTVTGEIAEVSTLGDRLEVLVKDVKSGIAFVRDRLTQNNVQFEKIQPESPTLENVFTTLLRQKGSVPKSLAFPRVKSLAISEPAKAKIAISAQNLNRVFGSFHAVVDLNLDIRYGDVYGLLGANGAGKTTAIKMLCGLLPISSGEISLAGETGNLRSAELRQRIGYMSQKFTLYDDLTILENLQFYSGVYGIPPRQQREKISWVLSISGLEGQEHLLTRQLPGGWKQRVAFGASVIHEPEILFLDEPTSGVDVLARQQFWQLINDFARHGTAILVTTHYMNEAEQCSRMCFMVAGRKVAEGSASEIKAAQPGQLFELKIGELQGSYDRLRQFLEPWRVSIFGDRLHVVLDHPTAELPQVRSYLQSANLSLTDIQPMPFSLEDAFIGEVQRAGGAPP
ncbi:ABC transporter ATP-binding protein [Anabaena cylindrica FACHB-243]|uniref:Sulfate-transporting ATPase, Phosphonate-transporting ATPase n=1 Tax=Anabaena cylindrica (strain ATCC 27899 / PCC 7122) TaxID=272123 RepID=K9ZQC5_ANACC|nr:MULTISPECIES: ATP-binding cassette domain-containing protein [Anabaena]AFZ60727.1 Sulfate-transporting ATPase, Phosphonate-transporting ATPase [Anabaena cylindrica PCC 7122]MBD2418384.1 ABC transporter ATP-binding protein [Anabaena cylindrica FACHB-243]MBY5280849.1 ABC transporter ATP-binding protein [Anabaena sp. CCAP 1446/1C]MBY5311046.1 ABC transporter ATP-binding protein [Anabaena sp. CCAP 1446/1C]MCM2408715.1 ATP-binding cassette domain-containing protein [Anabaena sp. CCAP 1446/1C]